MPLPDLPPKLSPEWYEHYAAMHGIAAEVDSGRLTDDALKAQAVDAVEAATTVAPTGAWDFAQAPTVGGVPVGSGAVDSVNGQTGAVVLDAGDVGAQPVGDYVTGTDPRLSDARTPTAHTHTASDISNSTATGRSVLTAADATTARTAIGAVPLWSDRLVPSLAAGVPTLMTSPPTIGAPVVGGPVSTIASAVEVPAIVSNAPNTAQISFRGGPWSQKGTVSPDTNYAAPTSLTGGQGATATYVEFWYYGSAFEFGYKGQGSNITRLWINDQPAEAPYLTDTTQDGTYHLRKVTFAAAGWYRVRIDCTFFRKLYTGPTDTVLPVDRPSRKLLVIHDSYGEGTGATCAWTGYFGTVGAMLGFNEVVSLSQGGTGVLAVNSGAGRPKYRDRQADWPQVGASAVLVGMSINDDSFTTAQLSTELQLLLPIVKALPGSPAVWVMGFAARGGGDVASKQTRDTALAATVQGLGIPYVSLVNPTSVWTGTGRQGATTGSGSSDVLMWTDGAHPTQAGHDAIARIFVSRLRAQLPAL